LNTSSGSKAVDLLFSQRLPDVVRYSDRSLRIAASLLAAVLLAPIPTRAAGERARVAVLSFDNETGRSEYDPLGKGLADMMITSLASVPSLQVLEREKTNVVIAELELQRTKYFDPGTAQKIGKGVGAQYLVAGSFIALEPTIQINVRVIQVDTNEVVNAAKVSGHKSLLFALQDELSQKIAVGLVSVLSEGDARKIREAFATNRVDDVDVLLAYGQGLDRQDHGDLEAASYAFQKAMDGAPEFALARSRYRQVMKEIYAAKQARAVAFSESERRLQKRVDEVLATDPISEGSAFGNTTSDQLRRSHLACRHMSYRILRGQMILRRLAAALERRDDEYMSLVGEYRDNQQKAIAEHLRFRDSPSMYTEHPAYHYGPTCRAAKWTSLARNDVSLAKELGIVAPGDAELTYGYRLMRDLARFLILGEPPSRTKFELRRAPCFYKSDPALVRVSLDLLDRAIADVARDEDSPFYQELETIKMLELYADVLLQLGKPEDAMGKLQTILTRFPKSRNFPKVEKRIRDILDGEERSSRCED
jgi:TolB-like protein